MIMIKEYSPFTPGLPVPVDFFVGRAGEVTAIVESVGKSVQQSSLERFFVSGERGIGKSSLCKYVSAICEKEYDVLSLHVFLGGVTTLEDLVRRIFENLLEESDKKPWDQSIKQFFGNHVRKVDLFGLSLEFDASKKDLTTAVNNFVSVLKKLMAEISKHKNGLLLILDDINGLASQARFANWIKSIVDELAISSKGVPVTLILNGIPERRYQLIKHQPSLDRVFDLIDIKRFNEDETKDFYLRTFKKVNVELEEPALDILVNYSGGFPVFMHEIGDAVFKENTDNKIDRHQAFRGVVRGARIIGEKYIEPKVLSIIRSKNYINILKKVGEKFSDAFSRQEMLDQLKPDESKVFDNFITKMRDLGVIHANKELGRGYYEFTNNLYALYFLMFASTERNTK